jgi:ABC-type sugar transport system permease subunit
VTIQHQVRVVTSPGHLPDGGVRHPIPSKRRPRPRLRNREVLAGFGLILPTVFVLLAVSLYPVLRTLWMSFRDTSPILQEDRFTGWQNLTRLLNDGGFWNAWKHTITFTGVSTLLETLLGLGIALVLHQTFRGRGFVRAMVLIPWAIPTVVTSRMFGYLFDGQNGLINYLLMKFHLVQSPINFIGNPHTAMGTIILADVWKTTPFMMLLILAALQTIPTELRESAALDGATAWRYFWAVRMPLIMPALLIAALLRTLDAFRIFDLPYVLTGGGPADSTEVMSTLAYKTLFSGSEYGYGSAMATAMFVTEIVIALGFTYFLVRRFRAVGA